MGNVILCTFLHCVDLELVIDYISKSYAINNNRIAIYNLYNDKYNTICVYSIPGDYELTYNTIKIHRKSDTNTLYTINALNELIKLVNNGVHDESYKVDWDIFANKLIIIKQGSLKKLDIEFNRMEYIK